MAREVFSGGGAMNPTMAAKFRCVRLFETLGDERLRAVAATCLIAEYAKGQQILSAQDSSNDVLFLLSGRIQVKNFSRQGREYIYSEVTAGELFGEFAAIDGLPRSAAIVAIEPALVARMKSTDFLTLLEGNFGLSLQLFRLLTAKCRSLTDRLLQLVSESAHDRMHLELARLAVKGVRDGRSVTIRPAPTHYEIAARVGSHREAVTKELNRLEALGYLRLGRRQITILDDNRFSRDFLASGSA
jgi:CRP/FNR family cyclic AMP-dependent transcriptional regulator